MEVNRSVFLRRRQREEGSALLIVFLMAAFVAIMLYKEMPVALFEAQRQKEELLVDRANEYTHAIKLFYLHNGQRYPTSIDQLESTNRVRYLRRRYKDPLTGKDEWRLIHVGPNFILLDSKVTPLKPADANAATTAATGTSGINSAAQGSAAGAMGGQIAYVTPGQPVAYHMYPQGEVGGPKRPPAAPAPGATESGENGVSGQTENAGSPSGTIPGNTTQASGSSGGTSANGNPQIGNEQQGTAGAGNGQASGQPASDAAMDAVNARLRQQGPINTAATSSNNGATIASGSIAGIASKAEGSGIKRINDQSQYAKWEFVYDPTKQNVPMMPVAVPRANNPNSGSRR